MYSSAFEDLKAVATTEWDNMSDSNGADINSKQPDKQNVKRTHGDDNQPGVSGIAKATTKTVKSSILDDTSELSDTNVSGPAPVRVQAKQRVYRKKKTAKGQHVRFPGKWNNKS